MAALLKTTATQIRAKNDVLIAHLERVLQGTFFK